MSTKTGPHHAIIWRLTSEGVGAAEWTTEDIELRSYFARTSGGSFSIRTNIVATSWARSTLWRSMAASTASASNFSKSSTVAPSACSAMDMVMGPLW